ncbi:MAG: AmmeMemoRadiSam system protein B [Thermodesulfobacteriota bacterium]
MRRKPLVAGQFYPADPQHLQTQVSEFLQMGTGAQGMPARLCMVPHAGYVFSGAVAGKTLAQSGLQENILLLGPNHTGRGRPLAVWARGEWELPGTALQINEALAKELIQNQPALEEDTQAHMYEHSLEVVLPFIHALRPEARIVPICVAEPDPDLLLQAGQNIGALLKGWTESVTIVVSSDMSHFLPQKQAQAQDNLALEAILALDPARLYQVVRDNRISMCGVLPMTLGLAAALELGCSQAELVDYATSGDKIGDYSQVVGYAGVLVH